MSLIVRFRNAVEAGARVLSRFWNSAWLDVLLIVAGCAISSGTYLADYFGGYGLYSFGEAFVLSLASIPAAFLVAILMAVRAFQRWRDRRGLAVVCLVATLVLPVLPFAVFAVGGPGASSFLDGFQDSLSCRMDTARLQDWAVDVLKRHAAGEVKLGPEPWNTLYGAPQLSSSEIPAWVNGLSFQPPAYVAIEDFGGDERCVMISWYLHGIIVGPPGYKTPFKAFEVRQIKPGIYVFIRER